MSFESIIAILQNSADVAEISGPVITTEKDAVKLAALGLDNIYALKLKTNLKKQFLYE